ncbi:MAG TPA: MFS transporter, partial [Coxiellaceae bacterium]|nr:MFS transporter [Coxiellaceae bacterium]
MQSFSLTAFGGGLLVSAYYYIYVLLQTPAGVLIDHYGPRLLLTVGALTCGLGTFMFAESHTLSMAFIARIIMGSGAAVGFVGSLSILSRWFPANQFGPMVGVLEMVGMLSATIGGYWIARWIQLTNWRVFMLGAGTFIIVIALLSWLIIRDQPRKLMKRIFRTKKEFLEDVSRLLKSRIAWVNGVYSGLLFSMATVFTALWGVNFIRLSHHVSLGVATISCNLLFAGIAVGGLSMGWLDNQILNRKKLCIGSPLTAAITLGLVIYVPSLPVWLMMLCIALTGFFISTYVLTFVVSSEIATSATRATSV